MSSPTSNIFSITRRSTSAPSNPRVNHDLSSMKTVKIGKHNHPVTIMAIAPVTCPSWQKKSCFDSLRTNAYHLASGKYKMADIVNMVMEEIPSRSSAAFQESHSASEAIRAAILFIGNLTPSAILNSAEQELDIDLSEPLSKRDEDISFVRFHSSVDSKSLDERMHSMEPLNINFCLRLPYHMYDVTNDKVNDISLLSPTNKKKDTPLPSKDDSRKLFPSPMSSPSSPTGSSGTASTPKNTFISPKISLLSKSGNSIIKNMKRGYFGKFDFLDSQMLFYNTFGEQPALLNEYPVKYDSSEVHDKITAYADRCRFDIFLWLCERNYYVGEDKVNKNLSLAEIGRTISRIKQEEKCGNQTIYHTPDELFEKFSAITTSLPDDASTWLVPLCSAFYSALIPNLSDAMADDSNFKLPNLTQLGEKSSQLDALRYVRKHAVKHFKMLQDQKEQINNAIGTIMGNRRLG